MLQDVGIGIIKTGPAAAGPYFWEGFMDLAHTTWNAGTYQQFFTYLQRLGEADYKAFNDALIPGTPHTFGIRIPALRRLAKEILKGDYGQYLLLKKGDYHEEVIIEGLVMAGVRCGYAQMLGYMKAFTDKIYNWAICDTVSFKGVKKHREEFIADVDWFIDHKNPWAVRFGFGALMAFYLDDAYIDTVLEKVERIDSDFYYVQMMQAWLLATAFAKCRPQTLAFLERGPMNAVTTNMAVRKIRESLRIPKEDKELALQFKK